MFRQLAKLAGGPARVFLYHPSELADYLESFWALRSRTADRPSPASPQPFLAAGGIRNLPPKTDWHHLMYAYLIECTFIDDIFYRVMYECLNGERLGILTPESQLWIRNTEDLFYKNTPPFLVYSVKSELRPDNAAIRRNAYYRMFGIELPQPQGIGGNGTGDNGNYVKPEASNLQFTEILEQFLSESWVGIENVRNVVGANPTDNRSVADHARRLYQMLRDRRQNGTLSREEFFAVAMMSWFHLTVEFNSPIIVDLRAEGISPEERLKRVGEKVKFPPHTKSDSYFQLAEPMSRVLNMIETNALSTSANVPVLYNPAGPLRNDIETVITHWSITTGRMLKANNAAGNAVNNVAALR